MLLLRRALNRLGRPLGINPFPRAFHNILPAGLSAQEVFDRIHDENFWGSSESKSGLGSERGYADAYCKRLHELLRRRGLLRIFDAPCGDLNWCGPLLQDRELSYTGGDISGRVVQIAKAKYPDKGIRVFDITSDRFPEVDVWHCRDCLFHLPFEEIKEALNNFARSKIPYALLTTHAARLLHRNLDVNRGGFRYLDLRRSPFGLPAAIEYLPDFRKGRDFPRYVGLWSRENVAQAMKQPNE